MMEILIFITAASTLMALALLIYIFLQNKKNKTFDKNDPEFLILQKEITIF